MPSTPCRGRHEWLPANGLVRGLVLSIPAMPSSSASLPTHLTPIFPGFLLSLQNVLHLEPTRRSLDQNPLTNAWLPHEPGHVLVARLATPPCPTYRMKEPGKPPDAACNLQPSLQLRKTLDLNTPLMFKGVWFSHRPSPTARQRPLHLPDSIP
jgi:hypothetical protein